MKFNTVFPLKKTLIALVFCASSFATISAEEDRSLSTSEVQLIKQQRYTENPLGALQEAGLTSILRSFSNDQIYLDRIHKLAYYAPLAIYDNGRVIELFDYSKWFIHALEKQIVRKWVKSDTIFIKPNSSCFSMYDYVLYNQTTKEAVDANFGGIPKNYQVFTQRIIKIDYYERRVQLDDPEGTVWEISYGDYAFDRWQYGDYILVGVNNEWRSSTFPHILINASIGGAPYSEAIFYGYGMR